MSDSWHLGACTMPIVAALWVRLIELKLIELDATLSDIFEDLPSIDPGWTNVSIRHVLQCRAGFPMNIHPDTFEAAWGDDRPLAEQRSAVVAESLQRPPISRDRFSYSALSYIVVGAAIDRVAQTSFEQALETYLMKPLGIRTAGFGPPRELCGHAARIRLGGMRLFRGPAADPQKVSSDNPPVFSSAGTLHVSLDDWSTLTKIILTRNEIGLLGEQSLNIVFQPPVDSDRCMALGWMQAAPRLKISYFMQGSNTFWSATSVLTLDRRRSALIVCNDGRSRLLNRCARLALKLLQL